MKNDIELEIDKLKNEIEIAESKLKENFKKVGNLPLLSGISNYNSPNNEISEANLLGNFQLLIYLFTYLFAKKTSTKSVLAIKAFSKLFSLLK